MENTVTLPLDRYHHLLETEKVYEGINHNETISIRFDYNWKLKVLNPKESDELLAKQIDKLHLGMDKLIEDQKKEVNLLKEKLKIYNDDGRISDFKLEGLPNYDWKEVFFTLNNKISIYNKMPWYKRIFKKI